MKHGIVHTKILSFIHPHARLKAYDVIYYGNSTIIDGRNGMFTLIAEIQTSVYILVILGNIITAVFYVNIVLTVMHSCDQS